MGKGVFFIDMQFNNLFSALKIHQIDITVFGINITDNGKIYFDFASQEKMIFILTSHSADRNVNLSVFLVSGQHLFNLFLIRV